MKPTAPGRGATIALVVAAAFVIASRTPEAAARAVALAAEDGVALAGTLHEAAQRPAPAVILLHMQTRSREDWQGVGNRLADAGIHALAIDFRGHGGSSSGPSSADGAAAERYVLDVRAAYAYLVARPDLVRTSAIGIAGASIGANVAILAAAAEPRIRSLALLSAGLDYRSLRAEPAYRQLAGRRVVLVAGTDDPYAMRSLRQLAEPGGAETWTFERAGHGTVMLSRHPALAGSLVDWFLRTLL